MAGGRGSRSRSRPRARAASAVASLPRSASGGRLELSRIAPSGRSLLTGTAILLTALGLYAAARTTSMFAVDRIAVGGASPEVAAQVRKAVAPALGESLLEVDLNDVRRRAEDVPMVASATLDRSFPHVLEIVVVPEVPVAVLRQGSSSWLAAAGGRVVAELEKGERPGLPRIWLKRGVDVRVGESLRGLQLRAVAAVAPLVRRPLPRAVTSVVATGTELTLVLRSGLELRLGDPSDLAVKLEVARRVLNEHDVTRGYLDVSVPERPVAGETLNSQVEVEAAGSSTP
ncbi:MAG: cell division protein FtsQ/DivIB [Gaiellaceae bacterium]